MSGTVVVSGLSVASPNGLGTQDYWSATTATGAVSDPSAASTPRPTPPDSRARSPGSSPRTTCRAGCCRRPTG